MFREACDVARLVVKSTLRASVRGALDSLRAGSSLVYGAFQARQQFAKLLELDAAVGGRGSPDFDPLPREAIRQVVFAHAFIAGVNERLLMGLLSSGCKPVACDPYALAAVDVSAATTEPDVLALLESDAVRALRDLFRQHPSVETLSKEKYLSFSESRAGAQFLAACEERTLKQSIHPTQQGIDESCSGDLLRELPTIPLLKVRRSLWTLDQLLFTAFMLDSLPAVDGDSIFSARAREDLLGTIAELGVQPASNDLMGLHVGDLLNVIPPGGLDVPRGPTMVLRSQTRITVGLGAVSELTVRFLDEWMDPFPSLKRQ